jgi:4-cresol dehydrogenase (hydroxylating)
VPSSILNTLFIPSTEAQTRYGTDTGGAVRHLGGTLVVQASSALPEILGIANRERLKLWPISGGRNFGYGTSLPVEPGSILLDLSPLKGIEYFADSQTFALEPGVTQQDLADYLDQHQLDYLIPTTGVGPNGSLVGNALDGGYGLTPVADHFDALTAIEGFWGNGEPFQHTYQALGCEDMARRWSQGIGPSTQSLLRQGNFGIVTKATIRMARTPEACRVLILEWPTEHLFFSSQDALSRLTEELPLLGGIIAMNGPRILSTQADAPLTSELKGEARQHHFAQLCSKREVAAWTGVGTMYGPACTMTGAVRDIRRRLPGVRVWAFTPKEIRLLQALTARLPKNWFSAKRRHLGALVNMLGTVEGRPIVAFLRIAYALDKSTPAMDATRHPAKDGQGILWYAPLVPFTEKGLRQYVATTSRILKEHDFDPLLAVTTRSSRVHSGTIPLNFKKTEPDASRAQACYRALVSAGVAQDMPPYRIGIDYMDQVYAPAGSSHDRTWAHLRAALDPNGVVAPGRYIRPLAGV